MMMGITVPHLHLLLNHIPTVGGAAALVLLLVAFARKSNDLKRIAIEATYVVALLTFPSYLSGVGAQQTLLKMPDISQAFVDAHWNAALFTFVLMQLAGALAWLTLWKFRRNGTWSAPIVTAIFILSAMSFAAAARTAALGGDIRHPEILAVAPAAAEAAPAADAQPATEAAAPEGTATATEPTPTGLMTGRGLGRSVMDRNWVWPASEALHFIGLWLILGIILIVNLRLLGFMPSVPYSAVHRLLPWAALGLLINVVTGMVFVTATPDQYGENISFLWKIIFLMVAGLDLLYITVFEGPWHVESGKTPPLRVKIAGATAIISWVGVMYFGRMLPFLGNAF
jgi:hypothetical protein